MKAVLVFVDGVICDYRQRQHLSGTPDYTKREMIMKDAPTPDSVRCLLELSQRYKPVYMTARPETAKAATEEWLNAMNFPKGPLFVGPKQADRLVLAAALREEFEFEAGLGVRWEDNALHQAMALLEPRALKITEPAAHRADVYLESGRLLPAVESLRKARWGFL